MIRLAVDGMGGDNAPEQIVKGVLLALEKFDNLEILLYGDEKKMAPFLRNHNRLKVIHTDKYLDMGEKDPVGQLRKNKDASMFLAMRAVKEKEADAIVSAGPTQALVVASHMIIKRMPQMRRVAIAPIIPSITNKKRILLDSGANVDLKPEHLLDFAVYASVVAKSLLHIENPKVGLLNIGTEPGKGRELDVQTFELLSNTKEINFYGNVEPKEILDSEADILLSDGFTANIAMKTMEGTAKSLGKVLKKELTNSFFKKLIVGLFLRKSLKAFKQTLDPNEIGGAMIAGLQNIVVKAHGSSNAYAFYNGIRQAKELVEADVIGKVTKLLEKNEETV
ncbi:Phosphate acyltransferase [Alteracholeplasma palmae J233]|uniref:Phosphate acyltransferase n=1 Tax=Alteracholeplasma palmae (strain ATCC 49389 / J233) TaxID=1318466 RepID=U4KQL2_ALTPJ|nr:phosphate acyltransferase PlsX [Alteracholeplasma palmae]CCV64775.1 Phosphate acyltransferase [Alteracholeplasma palmae J233]